MLFRFHYLPTATTKLNYVQYNMLLLAFFFGSFSLVSFQATPRQQVTSHPNAAATLSRHHG